MNTHTHTGFSLWFWSRHKYGGSWLLELITSLVFPLLPLVTSVSFSQTKTTKIINFNIDIKPIFRGWKQWMLGILRLINDLK